METRALMPSLSRRMRTPFTSFRNEMDKLFNDWLASSELEPLRLFEGVGEKFLPRLDMTEREDALVVTLELPGVEQNDVEVELTKNTLIVRGEKKVEREEKEEGYLRHERHYGSFYREMALPWEVDVAKTEPKATFKAGVLEVMIPKPAAVQHAVRKIAIGA